MKWSQYLNTLGGALQENKLTRYVLLGLVGSNMILAVLAMSRHDIVVMEPPNLQESAEIGSDTAGAGIKEAWATYIATMLGNVTPRTAPYLAQSLGKLIAPESYKALLGSINEQTALIQDEQVTVQFVPSETFYLPDKDVVIVSGEFSMRGMRDSEKQIVRTYEIGLGVENYMVRVKSLKIYEGPWSPEREQQEKVQAEQTAKSTTTGGQG